MRKMLDILRGVFGSDPEPEKNIHDELMKGFQFDPVPERRAVSKEQVLAWADSIEAECRKTCAYLDLTLIEIHQRQLQS